MAAQKPTGKGGDGGKEKDKKGLENKDSQDKPRRGSLQENPFLKGTVQGQKVQAAQPKKEPGRLDPKNPGFAAAAKFGQARPTTPRPNVPSNVAAEKPAEQAGEAPKVGKLDISAFQPKLEKQGSLKAKSTGGQSVEFAEAPEAPPLGNDVPTAPPFDAPPLSPKSKAPVVPKKWEPVKIPQENEVAKPKEGEAAKEKPKPKGFGIGGGVMESAIFKRKQQEMLAREKAEQEKIKLDQQKGQKPAQKPTDQGSKGKPNTPR